MGHKATLSIPPAASTATSTLESHDLQPESRLREKAAASSPRTRRFLWNTSPPTPAAFVQPTCPLDRASTSAEVSSALLPQVSESPAIGEQAAQLASLNDTPYETHLMLAVGVVISIFILLWLALASAWQPQQAQNRLEVNADEQRDATREQPSSVGGPKSSNEEDAHRPDVFYGPPEDPLAQYAAPRLSAIMVTHRRHYVVLEAETERPLISSESEGTASSSLAGQQSDGSTSTSSASTTDAISDASGSPVDSPIFSLPSAYSQDSIVTGEDSAIVTPDDVPRPLELPQDPMMRGLVLNVTGMLSSLRNDPPAPLPCSDEAPCPTVSTHVRAETARAMLFDPKDCDAILAYLRLRHSKRAADDAEGPAAKGEDEILAEYKAALARVRQRRSELDLTVDASIDKEKPDLSAVRHMSQRFRESLAAGTAPYGKGTKEEIRKWLRDEGRGRRAARRSADSITLDVVRKPDLVGFPTTIRVTFDRRLTGGDPRDAFGA